MSNCSNSFQLLIVSIKLPITQHNIIPLGGRWGTSTMKMFRTREQKPLGIEGVLQDMIHPTVRDPIEHKLYVESRTSENAEIITEAETNTVEEYAVHATFIPCPLCAIITFTSSANKDVVTHKD